MGITYNLSARLRNMQTSCPIKIRYVFAAIVDNVFEVERDLHFLLKEFKVTGEWFKLSPKVVKQVIAIMRLANCDFICNELNLQNAKGDCEEEVPEKASEVPEDFLTKRALYEFWQKPEKTCLVEGAITRVERDWVKWLWFVQSVRNKKHITSEVYGIKSHKHRNWQKAQKRLKIINEQEGLGLSWKE